LIPTGYAGNALQIHLLRSCLFQHFKISPIRINFVDPNRLCWQGITNTPASQLFISTFQNQSH
jgi:hypothetical protein